MSKVDMERKEKVKKSAASGVIALIFLIIGFQAAIFFEKVINRPAPQVASEETTDGKPPSRRDDSLTAAGT